MQQRRADAAAWASADPILLDGEIGYDTTGNIVKVGDGVKKWSELEAIGNINKHAQISLYVPGNFASAASDNVLADSGQYCVWRGPDAKLRLVAVRMGKTAYGDTAPNIGVSIDGADAGVSLAAILSGWTDSEALDIDVPSGAVIELTTTAGGGAAGDALNVDLVLEQT